jgi:hypothetical protein
MERDGTMMELGTEQMAEFVRPWLEKMTPETVYVVTYYGPKVKRTVTGKYVSHDLTDVVLLTEGGRFNRVPINRIYRMNYFLEGRAPF